MVHPFLHVMGFQMLYKDRTGVLVTSKHMHVSHKERNLSYIIILVHPLITEPTVVDIAAFTAVLETI